MAAPLDPKNVHQVLARHQLADGMPMVMDLAESRGAFMRDARTGEDYLDFFTCFASWPIGYNHPLMDDEAFREELMAAALNNPSNSDLYTASMARFVETFATSVTPEGFDHHFWVAGGALAVENALKAAFDWKAQREGVKDDGATLVAMHFRQAFHGRSGYTMSLTNTDPTKVALFPKFCWPRVHNPAIEYDLDGGVANDIEAEEAKAVAEIEKAFADNKDRVACVIIEPMQGEGGDNHFRSEFFQKLRELCDANAALLIYDEVQTGFYGSGKPWLWQHKGVAPDIAAFGKKSQVCGIYAGPRLDEVEGNVFRRSSRINSTWGGNLVDMVRSRRFIEIIEAEGLADNVAKYGGQFLEGLRNLARERGQISNVRGVGSLVAFTLESPAARNQMLEDLMKRRLLALASGERAIRFRLPLMVGDEEIQLALQRIADCLPASVGT